MNDASGLAWVVRREMESRGVLCLCVGYDVVVKSMGRCVVDL